MDGGKIEAAPSDRSMISPNKFTNGVPKVLPSSSSPPPVSSEVKEEEEGGQNFEKCNLSTRSSSTHAVQPDPRGGKRILSSSRTRGPDI